METMLEYGNLSVAMPLINIDSPCTSSYQMLMAYQLEVGFVATYLLHARLLFAWHCVGLVHTVPIAVRSDV